MNASGSFRISSAVLQGLGGAALVAFVVSSEGRAGLQQALLFLATVGLVAGEIMHRIQFYKEYKRVGL